MLNINLTALVNSSPEKFTPDDIAGLAMLGASSEGDIDFIRACQYAFQWHRIKIFDAI